MKKIIILSSVIFGSVFGAFIFSQNFQNDQEDHIISLLEIDENIKKNITADFITGNIKSYTGAIPSELNGCMDSAPKSLNKGLVFARIDKPTVSQMLQEKQSGIFDLDGILQNINPVFGHALRNEEINWDWQKQRYDGYYIFELEKGAEPLFYCYFQNESSFFARIFQTENIFYGVSSDALQYEDEEEVIRVFGISENTNLVEGFTPWGSDIFLTTDLDKECVAQGTQQNTFSCSFETELEKDEIVTAKIILPDGREFTIIKIVGDSLNEDRYCTLNKGKMNRCAVQ